MKRTRSLWPLSLAAVAVVAMTVVTPASPAGACSCLAFEDAVEMSDPAAAFIGTVVDEQPLVSGGIGETQVALLYEVEKVFHGDVPSQVVVRTPADSAAGCGLGFRGRTAVLAFVEGGDALTTSSCSAMPADAADVAVEALLEETFGSARSPEPVDGVTLAGGDTGLPLGYLIGAGAFVLVLAGSAVMMLRRQA